MRRLEAPQAGNSFLLRAELIKSQGRDSTDFSLICRYFDGRYAFQHQIASGYSKGEEIEQGELERGLRELVKEILPHKVIVPRLGESDMSVEGRVEKGSMVDYLGMKDYDTPRLIIENPEASCDETTTFPSDSTPVQMVLDI